MSKRQFPTDLEIAKSLNKVLKAELGRVRSEEARLLEENRKQAEVIKELAETLTDLAEFWKHGTPVHPGSDIANEAMAQLKTLRSEGKIP